MATTDDDLAMSASVPGPTLGWIMIVLGNIVVGLVLFNLGIDQRSLAWSVVAAGAVGAIGGLLWWSGAHYRLRGMLVGLLISAGGFGMTLGWVKVRPRELLPGRMYSASEFLLTTLLGMLPGIGVFVLLRPRVGTSSPGKR